MLGALQRALSRLLRVGSAVLDRLRGTLAGIDLGAERVLIFDNNGPACPVCTPLHGTRIRVRNGRAEPDILPPIHPNCDCVVRAL